MNRRQFLAGAGVATAGAATGYGGLRVANIRPYNPSLPSGDSPRERIIDASRHLHAVDHRAVTNVQVLNDWTGEAPYDFLVRRQWHEYSRRRHLITLTTFENPLIPSDQFSSVLEALYPQNLLAHTNQLLLSKDELPSTEVLYYTDGTWIHDSDAPMEDGDTVRISDALVTDTFGTDLDDLLETARRDFIRPHQVDWTVANEEDKTITYRISGLDAYAQVVPLNLSRDITYSDSWLEVTLYRESNRIARISDLRNIVIDSTETTEQFSLTYRIKTEFDQYGKVTARRPEGSVNQSLTSRAKGLYSKLMTY